MAHFLCYLIKGLLCCVQDFHNLVFDKCCCSVCDSCKIENAQSEELDPFPMFSHCDTAPMWKCEECAEVLSNKQLYELHMQRYHPVFLSHGVETQNPTSEGLIKHTLYRSPHHPRQSVADADGISRNTSNDTVHAPGRDHSFELYKGGKLYEDVQTFYSSFGDYCEDIESYCTDVLPSFHELLEAEKIFIRFCLKQRYPSSKCESLFGLLSESVSFYFDIGNFEQSTDFANYIDRMRQAAVVSQGWKTVVLKNDNNDNRSGLMRDIVQIMKEELKQLGTDSIIDFEEETVNGQRHYGHPMSCEATRLLFRTQGIGMKKVYFSLYCDATTLNKSCTQSRNMIRIRFDNLKGRRDVWHEVGICPTIPCPETIKSATALAKSRAELFHRFLFLIMKSAMECCQTGMLHGNSFVSPHLLMVVSDQPQERVLYAHKNVGSYRDCTMCTAVSKALPLDLDFTRNREEETGIALSYGRDDRGDHSTAPNIAFAEGRCAHRDAHFTTKQALIANQPISQNIAQRLNTSVHEMRNMKKYATSYLSSMSAHLHPSSLAAWPGFSHIPSFLFKSIGFDLLHVMDLGVLRIIPDNSHFIFARKEYEMHGSKAGIIRVVNQRLIDLPKGSPVPRKPIFLTNKGNLQSGMTGKVRRVCLPFLWAVLIGTNPTVEPDDDKIVQAALLMNEVYSEMKGINSPADAQRRNIEDIDSLQRKCHRLGKMLMETFNNNERTKIHRMMYHVRDHIVNYGDFVYGNTAENEAIHKDTKNAYGATNKKGAVLGRQLLNVRSGADEYETAQHAQKRRKVQEYSYAEAYRLCVMNHCEEQKTSREELSEEKRLCLFAEEELRKLGGPRDSWTKALQLYQGKKGHKFESITRARIAARYPWMSENVRQTIFAFDKAENREGRRDFVKYKDVVGGEEKYGQVEAILVSKHGSIESRYVCIVREMVECEPESENTKVVYEYGITRLKYRICGPAECKVCFVGKSDILHRVMVLRDMHWATKKKGLNYRMNEPYTSKEEMLNDRFFVIAVQVSSFGGYC